MASLVVASRPRRAGIPRPRNALELPLFVALKHRFWPPHYGWLTSAYKDMDEFLVANLTDAVGSGTDLRLINPSPRPGSRGRPRAPRRELAAVLVYGGGVPPVALAQFVTWVRLAWGRATSCERLMVTAPGRGTVSRWAVREEGFRNDLRSLLRGVRQSKLKPQTWWLAEQAPAIAGRAVLALAKRIGTTRAEAMADAAFERYPGAPRVQLPDSDEYEHTLQPRIVGEPAQQQALLAEIACFNRQGLAGVRYQIEDLRHFSTVWETRPASRELLHGYLQQFGWPPIP